MDLPGTWKRGRIEIPVLVRDGSLHGLRIVTNEWIRSNQLMDVRVELPGRAVSFLVTSRYVGPTRQGHGIGASILSADPEELRRWVSYYAECAQQPNQLRRCG